MGVASARVSVMGRKATAVRRVEARRSMTTVAGERERHTQDECAQVLEGNACKPRTSMHRITHRHDIRMVLTRHA